jgi:hypothetical protein
MMDAIKNYLDDFEDQLYNELDIFFKSNLDIYIYEYLFKDMDDKLIFSNLENQFYGPLNYIESVLENLNININSYNDILTLNDYLIDKSKAFNIIFRFLIYCFDINIIFHKNWRNIIFESYKLFLIFFQNYSDNQKLNLKIHSLMYFFNNMDLNFISLLKKVKNNDKINYERIMSLQILFLIFLSLKKPPKYLTDDFFLGEYPQFSYEINKLLPFANWMNLLFYTINPKSNKGFTIDIVTRLCEGHKFKHITGSGQTKFTQNIVDIYHKESGVKIIPKIKKKRSIDQII